MEPITGLGCTPQHYRKLFRDAGLTLAEELGPYYIGFVRFQQPAFFPNVDVYAEKGLGLETLVGVGAGLNGRAAF